MCICESYKIAIDNIYLPYMENPEEYQKLFKMIQSISYLVGVMVSSAVLVKIIKATGVNLESGFDFLKIVAPK